MYLLLSNNNEYNSGPTCCIYNYTPEQPPLTHFFVVEIIRNTFAHTHHGIVILFFLVDTCYCKLPETMAPTIAPSISPFELVTIKFDVVGLPIDVTSEQMSNEGLLAVNRITLLLGDLIDGLEVMEVKVGGEEGSNATTTTADDATTVRRRRRRLKDETMMYDVYVARDESGILFGPIIAETMKDNYNEIWKAIR